MSISAAAGAAAPGLPGWRATRLVQVNAPGSFAAASRRLLRDTLLDGLESLLAEKDWAKVTMADIARHAGVSRQTVYNEFGTRMGLAQAYAMRLVDRFVTEIEVSIAAHPGDVEAALHDGFTGFFTRAAQDPMIASLLSGEAKPELLRLITTDAAPLIASAAGQVAAILRDSWIGLDEQSSIRTARLISRTALSYIAMPPEPDADAAADLATALTPTVIAARGH